MADSLVSVDDEYDLPPLVLDVLDRRYKQEPVSPSTVINVKDYGAIGDGVADDLPAIRAAVAAAPAGSTVLFPPGTYTTPYSADSALEANYLVIDKNGTTLSASPGSVILENFLIYLKGSYGTPVNIGATPVNTGDRTVTTATAHGVGVGQYVQLLSTVNPYTSDAGSWQMGSANPTSGALPECRFAEIHRVSAAPDTTTLTLNDMVIYPGYKNNVTGQAFPVAGVTSAQVRKLSMLSGVTVQGLTFRNTTTTSFRGIIARACEGLTFEDVRFVAGSLPGAHFKATDCFNTNFVRCSSLRRIEGISGSAWNSFFIGGGCQETTFSGCDFIGEGQAIDFTPNCFITDVGYNSVTEYLTCQVMRVENSRFTNCSDAFTSHPATYLFEALGNTINGGSTGIRARSLVSIIRGNTILTSRAGISLSSFISGSTVSDNDIRQLSSSAYAAFWIGIDYSATSSEVMSNNQPRTVYIADNRIIRAGTAYVANAGISFGHSAPTFAGFVGFDDALKARLSDIVISRNHFHGCSINLNQWINGVYILDNTFKGGSDRTNYVAAHSTSTGHTVAGNRLLDTLAAGISVPGYTGG